MSSASPTESTVRNPLWRFIELVIIAVIISGVFLGALLMVTPMGRIGGLEPGNRLPAIRAEGWLNGSAPTANELAGKVIVVDVWASWCGVCFAQAPELIELYEKFQGKDVVFLGLTGEGEDQLEAIEDYLKNTDIPWRNGYGAVDTSLALKADYLPGTWVVDRRGIIAWNNDSSEPLADAIENALAKK